MRHWLRLNILMIEAYTFSGIIQLLSLATFCQILEITLKLSSAQYKFWELCKYLLKQTWDLLKVLYWKYNINETI